MGKGKEVSASEVQKLINQNAAPNRIASLDDGPDYFSKDAQKLLDSYKQTYWNTASTTATSDARTGESSGTTTTTTQNQTNSIPSLTSNPDFNPAQWTVETGPLTSQNLYAGVGGKLGAGLTIGDQTWNGLSIADRQNAYDNQKISLQYEADYGLRELQGEIDRGLAKMQYENEQLGLDKQINNSIWLDRTKNIAANRQQLSASAAQMLSNL